MEQRWVALSRFSAEKPLLQRYHDQIGYLTTRVCDLLPVAIIKKDVLQVLGRATVSAIKGQFRPRAVRLVAEVATLKAIRRT
jgi:hypothetical protein